MEEALREEINKTIAVRLFGLVEGKDYGEWPEHDWIRECDDWLEAEDYEDLLTQNSPEERAKSSIDDFAYESGYCNGPRCARCGEEFCKHCEPDRWEKIEEGELDGPCIIPIPDYFLESWAKPLMEKFFEEYCDEYAIEFERMWVGTKEQKYGNYRVLINHIVGEFPGDTSSIAEAPTMQEALVVAIYKFLKYQD